MNSLLSLGEAAFRVTQLPADHAGERCGDDTEQQRHEGPEREITSTRAALLIITIMPRRAPNRNATATL